MIVMIDNYDSFVHNLARYFEILGAHVFVVRNDQYSVAQIAAMKPESIVISPGPCSPNEAGVSLEVVEQLGSDIPILGICLGHQAIGQVYGAVVTRASNPMHGRSSSLSYVTHPLLAGLPDSPKVGRYHSLVLKELPSSLQVIAKSEGEVMAIVHKAHPVVGLQFHPESILTEQGEQYIANFLKFAKTRQGLGQIDNEYLA